MKPTMHIPVGLGLTPHRPSFARKLPHGTSGVV